MSIQINIIPFDKETHVQVQEPINSSKVLGSAYVDAQQIVSSDRNTKAFSIAGNITPIFDPGDQFEVLNSNDNDGTYTVKIIVFNNPNTVITVDKPIKSSSGSGAGFLAYTPVLRICGIDTVNKIFKFCGDYATEITGGNILVVFNSKSNVLDLNNNDGVYTITNISQPVSGDTIKSLIETELNAVDLHMHITLAHLINAEKGGSDFYGSPGSNRDSGNEKFLDAVKFSSPLPAVSTYRSFMDGRVKIILNSLHNLETAFASGFLFNLGLTVLDSLDNSSKNDPEDKISFPTRMRMALRKIKKSSNWNDFKDDLEYFKKHIASNSSRFLHIGPSTDPNDNGPNNPNNAPLIDLFQPQPFSDNGILKCLINLEGGHQFDYDVYKLPDGFEDNMGARIDPNHELYGGFLKNAINFLENPTSELYERFKVLINEAKMITWIPMHAFWNGLGGFGRAISRYKNIQNVVLPDPDNYMHRTVGAKKLEVGGIAIIDDDTKGFRYDKNTHLTELGRQMIKFALKEGIIIDLKHTHRQARKQIIDMVKNGQDFPPSYDAHGNPEVDANGNIVPAPNSTAQENRNKFRPNEANNKYQIKISHAALSFVEKLADIPDTIKEKIENGEELTAQDLLNNPVIRYDAHLEDTMSVDNEELTEIIKLGGVLAVISEDRVLRQNEEDFLIEPATSGSEHKLKEPENKNTWPFYNDNANFGTDNASDMRMPDEVDLAFGTLQNSGSSDAYRSQDGLLPMIQTALEQIHQEFLDKYTDEKHEPFRKALNLNRKLYKKGIVSKDKIIKRALAGAHAFYKSIDHISKVARKKVYDLEQGGPISNSNTFSEVREKLLKHYSHISIATDFDGATDPIDLFSSPRMYPIMVMYIANRLKWDIYRRYIDAGIDGNDPIPGPFASHPTNKYPNAVFTDEGFIGDPNTNSPITVLAQLNNNDFNQLILDIIKQILHTNIINQIKLARNIA